MISLLVRLDKPLNLPGFFPKIEEQNAARFKRQRTADEHERGRAV